MNFFLFFDNSGVWVSVHKHFLEDQSHYPLGKAPKELIAPGRFRTWDLRRKQTVSLRPWTPGQPLGVHLCEIMDTRVTSLITNSKCSASIWGFHWNHKSTSCKPLWHIERDHWNLHSTALEANDRKRNQILWNAQSKTEVHAIGFYLLTQVSGKLARTLTNIPIKARANAPYDWPKRIDST